MDGSRKWDSFVAHVCSFGGFVSLQKRKECEYGCFVTEQSIGRSSYILIAMPSGDRSFLLDLMPLLATNVPHTWRLHFWYLAPITIPG